MSLSILKKTQNLCKVDQTWFWLSMFLTTCPSASYSQKAAFFLLCYLWCTPTLAFLLASPSSSLTWQYNTILTRLISGLKERDWPSDNLVQPGQFEAQCSKDSGDDCGFRKSPAPSSAPSLQVTPSLTVDYFCFLGTIFSEGFKRELKTSTVPVEHKMHFLKQLKFNLPRTKIVTSSHWIVTLVMFSVFIRVMWKNCVLFYHYDTVLIAVEILLDDRKEKVHFLDVGFINYWQAFLTLHRKKTDQNPLLPATSSHPTPIKRGLPKGQFFKLMRIFYCTKDVNRERCWNETEICSAWISYLLGGPSMQFSTPKTLLWTLKYYQ